MSPEADKHEEQIGAEVETKPFQSVACDQHLARLARWLRLSGFRTHIVSLSSTSYPPNALTNCELPVLVISRCQGSLRHVSKHMPQAIILLILANNLEDQILQLEQYGIDVRPDPAKCFCPDCGDIIVKRAKQDVLHMLPTKVKQSLNEFWQCSNCDKVFWIGIHWKRIADMRAAMDQLSAAQFELSTQEEEQTRKHKP